MAALSGIRDHINAIGFWRQLIQKLNAWFVRSRRVLDGQNTLKR